MANRNRTAGARGSVATANRPRPQPQNNPAIEPQAAAPKQLEEVLVHTDDFQIDDDLDGDEGTGSITELPDLPIDIDGVQAYDDGSPVFDINGEEIDSVQELGRYGDVAVDTGPRTDEISFVSSATDDDDDENDEVSPNEELLAAQRILAEAQEIRRQAQLTLAEAERTAAQTAAKPGMLQRLRGAGTAVEQSSEPVILDAPQKFRILRTIEDIGPVFYGKEEIHLLKGRRYKVPEHIYVYLAERDMIHSMG